MRRLPPLLTTAATSFAALGCYGAAVPVETADAVPAGTAQSAPAAPAAAARQIHYRQFDSGAELRTGSAPKLRIDQGRMSIDPAARDLQTRRLGGTRYESAGWQSPWVEPGFAFTQLIPSWSATTPDDSFVEVFVRGREGRRTGSWDLMARWTSGDQHLERTTDSGQDDDLGDVNVDTWRARGTVTGYQLRVVLHRRAGTDAAVAVDTIGAVASRLPDSAPGTSEPGVARGRVLDVPRYSQMVHKGHSPQWGGGGEAWCSPTSTSMVLAYYESLPAPRWYRWVGKGHVDPWVDHAARMTYDHDYDGTGNWPFNTAYAAPRAGKAFVTRLRSLREAERFIAAGIPLVASVSFGSGELDGAPIGSTAGHLLVIVGFTQSGDVVVNDPAAETRKGVRRTYDRGQLEDAWLNGSGGLVYVIRDTAHPLPKRSPGNW
ncbi:peptidase C39 family protein [Nocardioides marinquilinus]|uniref:Peptidase C39 family protein n=1 Tax=Nocardioides marinquilinus TaxID=1210400 RepID=A0ABP9P8X7_9ACTN